MSAFDFILSFSGTFRNFSNLTDLLKDFLYALLDLKSLIKVINNLSLYVLDKIPILPYNHL